MMNRAELVQHAKMREALILAREALEDRQAFGPASGLTDDALVAIKGAPRKPVR